MRFVFSLDGYIECKSQAHCDEVAEFILRSVRCKEVNSKNLDLYIIRAPKSGGK
jgi:hypothetical protein